MSGDAVLRDASAPGGEACPACGRDAFSPAGTEVTLEDVFARWEEALGTRLPDVVRNDYAPHGARPLRLSRCAACGFGSFLPRLAGTEAFYESIAVGDYYVGHKWEHEIVRTLIAHRRGRVLDVGAGAGQFLRATARARPDLELWACEFNPRMQRELRAMGMSVVDLPVRGGGAPRADPEEARLAGTFEVVTLFQVLEHLEDPFAMIERLRALLRPGGSFFVSVPDADGPLSKFPDALTELPPHHVTRWTERALRSTLEARGLLARRVLREPLPSYLWDGYLPQFEPGEAWPLDLMDRWGVGVRRERAVRMGWLAAELKALGVDRLHGVPGHTLLLEACPCAG